MSAGCRWWLVIRRAIAESEGKVWEKDTKTHQRRHIALDVETVAVLMEHRERVERDVTALGIEVTNEHYIFPGSPTGCAPTTPSSMSQRYARCAKRLGIDTTLKNLRHYSATELITAGVDIRTVAGRLGHGGGGTTTLKVYAAWVAAADQHACQVLMNRMPQQRPTTRVASTRITFDARLTHERIAAELHRQWVDGTLKPGTPLPVKAIAAEHAVAIGTAHLVLTLLGQLGVVLVRNGRTTTVATPSTATATVVDESTLAAVPELTAPPVTADIRPSIPGEEPGPVILTLDLLPSVLRCARCRPKLTRTISTRFRNCSTMPFVARAAASTRSATTNSSSADLETVNPSRLSRPHDRPE